MTLFFAQVTTNTTIQGWLNALVPLAQIVKICNAILPAFVLVAIMLLAIGYVISLCGSDEVFAPSISLIVLFACIAAAPWLMSIAQSIANGLVGAVASVDPQLNWLVVNNPNNQSLALNFTQPYGVIGQYVAGATGPAPAASLFEIGKWPDYIMRAITVAITGGVACVTVFIMQVMLVLQKLIIVGSGPLMPIFIACLSIPAARGSAQNFIKAVLGTMCWPVGWALAHVGTMAALQNLQAPSWNASLGQLILSFITLAVICLWMVVGTIGAPALIAWSVTHGTNFAAGLVGTYASAAGQHASSAVKSGATVAGALAGSSMGPAGAVTGASIGAMAGNVASAPIASATQSAEGVNGSRHPIPSSRSAAAADLALKAIKARA
jgi:hypothetical protein